MPKQLIELNNFIGGLHTESTPLAYPENTAKELTNFTINRDGSISIREGLSFVRNNAAELTNVTVGAADVVRSTDGSKLCIRSPLTGWLYVTAADSTAGATMTKITGDVVVSAPVAVLGGFAWCYNDSVYYYDISSGSTDTVRLRTRDVWGVDDGLGITERPSTLTELHEYNLYNQGWQHKFLIPGPTTSSIASTKVFTAWGNSSDNGGAGPFYFASNSDLYSLCLNILNEFEAVNARRYNQNNTEAGKGRFIIDMFDRGASRKTEALAYTENSRTFTTLPTDQSIVQAYNTKMAIFSGRAFYWFDGASNGPDDRSPRINTYIWYSNLITNPDDLGKCYQKNDPTDTEQSDLLPTDGGFLEIPDLDRVVSMVPLVTGLLIVTESKVYYITGPDGVFRADDYSIELVGRIPMGQLSSTRTYRPHTVTSIGSAAAIACSGGLYFAAPNQYGKMQLENKSNSRIRRFWDTFFGPTTSLHFVPTKQLLYISGLGTGGNRELVYDLELDSFYSYEYPNVTLLGYMPYDNDQFYRIADSNSGFDVLTTSNARTDRSPNGGSTAFEGKVSIGAMTFGSGALKKNLPYLISYFKRTEDGFTDTGGGNLTPTNPSSCKMRAKWNFADTTAGNKITTATEIYRYPRVYMPANVSDPFDFGEEVIRTKTRVSGVGYALELEFTTTPNHYLTMYGWSLLVDGHDSV